MKIPSATYRRCLAVAIVVGVIGVGASSASAQLHHPALNAGIGTKSIKAAIARALSAAPRAEAEAQAQAPASGVVGFFSKTELAGLADMYFTYNFNEPETGSLTPLRNFDTQHNQFSFALAEVRLVKPPTADDRVGFRIDLNIGPVAELVHSFEPDIPFVPVGREIFRNVQQAYLSYLAPAGNGLQLDVGKFVTQHGAEVIESIDNWNYSRSFMFALAIPYYHMGFRLTYPVNDKLTLQGAIVNGWNNATDNNDQKTYGVQAVIKPVSQVTIVQNYMGGPEQAGNDDDWRHLSDTTVTVTVNDMVSLIANYDYGRDEVAGESVNWQGIAGYARIQANQWIALVPRIEWYDDDDGFTTGLAQTLKEFTFTFEVKHSQGLVMRTEYRRDWSDTDFFAKDGRPKDNQDTFTVGLVYAFSTR